MRALVVVNHAATTTTPRALDVMLSALRHDLTTTVVETTHRGHAYELGEKARVDGLDLIVAFGGDGTANEVVNGLLAEGPGRHVPALALVPGGSTNVLARNLGLPVEPVEATGAVLDAIRSGTRRSIGLGLADDRYFTFCASMGYDAEVVRQVEVQRSRGKKSTVPLYARSAVRRYFATDERDTGPISLSTPADTQSDGPVEGLVMAIVSNCSPWTYIGSRGLVPSPDASFDEGLDVIGLTRLGVASILRHAAEITFSRGGPRGKDVVRLHDQEEVVLRASRPVAFQLDGDYLGERDSVVLRSVPDGLTVLA